jgi:hypothetical protein
LPNGSYFRRSDTERPKVPNGPTHSRSNSKSKTEIASLSEALNTAKKDLEDQGKKLRDLQDLLVKERVRREDAEARASKLEQEQQGKIKHPEDNGANGTIVKTEKTSDTVLTPIEDESNSEIGKKKRDPEPANETATEKLQRRLDLLLAELQEVKVSSERWKQEKEEAERERDEERKERLSLSEMIESMRKAERERSEKKERSRGIGRWRKGSRRREAASTDGNNSTPDSNNADIDSSDDEHEMVRHSNSSTPSLGLSRNKEFFANGHTNGSLLRRVDGKATMAGFDSHQLAQAAPYLSAMSVVLIGVAVMALVNKMSGNER